MINVNIRALATSIMGYFSFEKTYFIAEIGSNFDGSIERAKKLIDLAKSSGANAAKFQNYSASTLIAQKDSINLRTRLIKKDWKDTVFNTYKKAELNIDWVKELAEYANKLGIDFLTSAYSIDLLKSTIQFVPFIKIGSGDISDIDFIKVAAQLGKPIALATGASSMNDVERAVNAIGNSVDVCLMQCNTNYESCPDHHEYQNLSVIKTFKERFPQHNVGLSCHMKSNLSVYVSVSLGATVVEKHFTDDTSRVGPDHKFAQSPSEFLEMVKTTRLVESLLGDGIKKVEKNEFKTFNAQRRSIVASRDLRIGEVLSEKDFVYLRPFLENCYHPFQKHDLIGKRMKEVVKAGEPINQSTIIL